MSPLLEGTSVAFAAATGSGKTLAYLLPLFQRLKLSETETAPRDSLAPPKSKRPRAIILGPTRELCQQIFSVIKSLSHSCKLSSALIVGGEDYGIQRRSLDRVLDIVVATPGRLVKHRVDKNVFLGSVENVVIDETDTMIESGFAGDLAALLHPMYYDKGTEPTREPRESSPQFVMTTATMTTAVRRLLEPENPAFKKRRPSDKDEPILYLPNDIERISAHGLHRVVPRLRQTFVDVGSTDKLSLLTDVISRGSRGAAPRKGERDALTMVFCNTVASCRAAEHALAESGIESLCYHGELGSTARVESLKAFRAGAGVKVLVCTDIAARGLDIPEVDHVVMFDFPLNPIDYLHRAGRTARGLADIGARGRVTALVAKRDKVLATAIERAVQMGMPLDELTSRKSDYRTDGKLGKKISAETKSLRPARPKLRVGEKIGGQGSITKTKKLANSRRTSPHRSRRGSGIR